MTVTRIDRLTPEQKNRMASWAEEWIAIGLSTAPADRVAAEAAGEVDRTVRAGQGRGRDPPADAA